MRGFKMSQVSILLRFAAMHRQLGDLREARKELARARAWRGTLQVPADLLP